LGEELEARGITGAEASRIIGVPENRISAIVRGARNMTADTALRLGKWLGTGPQFWMNLQVSYELRLTQQEIAKDLESIPAAD
jgi:addiction module HigA family antidote